MLRRWLVPGLPILVSSVVLAACGNGGADPVAGSGSAADQPTPVVADGGAATPSVNASSRPAPTVRPSVSATPRTTPSATARPVPSKSPSRTPTKRVKPSPTPTATPTSAKAATGPRPGTTGKRVAVPAAARAVDTSKPTRVIGNGTPASCTSKAVVAAVAKGGVITFRCGPKPVVITMTATAKVRNTSSRVVLDGGGLVTLSGAGKRRILYQNTCDEKQIFTTSHCDNQATPQLTVQNLTFADGNSTGERTEGGGGGAIFVRGGRLKVVDSRFVGNRCDATGPDLGGAAIRALSQHQGLPVYVVGSTFGGSKGQGGVCSNGGAISSIGVSWTILNSLFSHNAAIGRGANPAKAGTPGGGSGGAIYADGNEMTLRIAGTVITANTAKEGGGAVFFVSNNRTGTMRVESSSLTRNRSAAFETAGFPGIFFLGAGKPSVVNSSLR